MALYSLKSFANILMDMIATVGANSPATDFNPGSVILTVLEAPANEIANVYVQMLNMIRASNLDTTSGTDLDDRAYEYGLVRFIAGASAGYVTFTDTSFEKIQTTIYTGFAGPSIGSMTVNIFVVDDFPTSGSVIIGRGTNSIESVPYTSYTDMGSYYQLVLSSPCTKNHGTDETVIVSQGGLRVIPAGTGVYVPESDLTDKINFVLQGDAVLLDGENVIADQLVICTQTGTIGNIGPGAIRYFASLPFPTAEVTNPIAISNGTDAESDAELRNRIRDTIQSLSRGTIASILTKVNQISSTVQNNKVISSKFVEATTLNEMNYLYIDDGTGLEPWFDKVSYEILLDSAMGGEKFLQIDSSRTPMMKANLTTGREEPFTLVGGETLAIEISGVQEQMAFDSTKIAVPGLATAEEVVRNINDVMTTVEARTAEDRKKVIIEPKIYIGENIKLVSASSTANTTLEFQPDTEMRTLYLYKNDTILTKDGEAAYIINTAEEVSGGYGITAGNTLTVKIDGKAVQTITFTGAEMTAQLVADAINAQISGALATVVTVVPGSLNDSGNRIRITSTNIDTGSSAVEVTGGAANAFLIYSTTEVVGREKDYALNRFNGQIELTSVLAAGDRITAGNPNTRAYLQSVSPGVGPTGTYTVVAGQTLIVQVDEIIDSTISSGASSALFTDSSLAALYPDDYFNGLQVRFKATTTTVANRGIARAITGYNGTLGRFSTAAFPATPVNGDVYEIVQTITIPGTPLVYDADDANTYLASQIKGVSFYSFTKNLDVYMRIQSNSYGSRSKIRVHPDSTAVAFGFPTATTATGEIGNYGYLESAPGPFTFGYNQNIVFVFDNDPAYKAVNVIMHVPGTVTSLVNTTTTFEAFGLTSLYTTTDCFDDMVLRWNDDTATVALQSQIRTITNYNKTTGLITAAAGPVAPAIGDTFTIIPRTTANLYYLFNNPAFTSLSTYADITQTDGGRRIQLSTKTSGSEGSVEMVGGTGNNFSQLVTIDSTTGGYLNTQFAVASVLGLSAGLDIYMKTAGGAPADLKVTILNIASSPTLNLITTDTDVSAYTTAALSYITDVNQANFSDIVSRGRDGYAYFTGLIQEAQWQIDGKTDDPTTYPGVKAAGVQIDVKAPVVQYVDKITLDVTTEEGINLSAVSNEVKAAVGLYVNTLGVGENVIISAIIDRVMEVSGVADVTLLEPTTNVAIAANELPRVLETSITVA